MGRAAAGRRAPAGRCRGPAGADAALLAPTRPCSLLPEHGEGWFGRPGLSGHRLDTGAGSGAALAEIGLAIPAQRTLTPALILIEAI